MINVALRVGKSKRELEYSLPVSEVDLDNARAGCKAWMKMNPMNPLDGAWGVQLEHGFIYKSVQWYSKLRDFDRIIALHAIADKHCRIVKG